MQGFLLPARQARKAGDVQGSATVPGSRTGPHTRNWAPASIRFRFCHEENRVGIPTSTAQDLVMPRMRAVAGAYFLLLNTMIGLALGPYFMGQLSDMYAATGMNSANSLQTAIATGQGIFIITLVLLTLAWKYLPRDEANRLERAKAWGEDVDGMHQMDSETR